MAKRIDGPASPLFKPVSLGGNVALKKGGPFPKDMVARVEHAPRGRCVCHGIPFRVGKAVLVPGTATVRAVAGRKGPHQPVTIALGAIGVPKADASALGAPFAVDDLLKHQPAVGMSRQVAEGDDAGEVLPIPVQVAGVDDLLAGSEAEQVALAAGVLGAQPGGVAEGLGDGVGHGLTPGK